MTGWSWELTKFMSSYPWKFMASPHQITHFPFFHVDLHCRRIKSGYHYQVAILADDTWRCLDDTLSTTPLQQNESLATTPDGSKTNFYTKIYDGLVCDESMRTDVDRKLALAVRESCQSHCSRAEREAVAVFTDISHLRINIASGSLYSRLCCKWAIIIFERAAKELSRLEIDLRVEKQKRHELLVAKRAEKAAKDAKEKQKEHELLMAAKAEKAAKDAKDKHDMVSRSDKTLQIEDSRLALQQRASHSGLEPGGAEDDYEELTRMMARWHL
jgi:uncharacterized protein YcnI